MSNGYNVPTPVAAVPATLLVTDSSTIGELAVRFDTGLSDLDVNCVASMQASVTIAISGSTIPADSTGVVNVQSGAGVAILTSSRIGTLNIPGSGVVRLQERSATPTSSGARPPASA